MDAINKFFESQACLYVIIGLLVLLLGYFVYVLLTNKKRQMEKISKMNSYYISDETKAIVMEDDANTNSEIKIIQEKRVEKPVPEEIKEEVVEKIEETVEIPQVKLEEPEEKIEEVPKEEIIEVIPEEMPKLNQDAIAFNSEAQAIDERNEDVKVEEIKEYTSEKTDIFEFPDFTGLNGNDSSEIDMKDLEKGTTIEKEIIDSANSFIESIMSR